MSSGSAIRGSRVGSGPMRPDERSEPAPRREVDLLVRQRAHRRDPVRRRVAAAGDLGLPPLRPARPAWTRQNPPGRLRAEPYKTHLAYVKERRSDEDGAAILAEALAKLRQRRGESTATAPHAASPRAVALLFSAGCATLGATSAAAARSSSHSVRSTPVHAGRRQLHRPGAG